QVSNMVLNANVDDIARLGQGDAPALFRIKPIHGEATKIAFRVTDVRNGELQVTGTAMIEDLAKKLKSTGFGPGDQRDVIRRRGRNRTRRFGFSTGGGAHDLRILHVAENPASLQPFPGGAGIRAIGML